MRKEIELKICCGTNCYIMGGSELHLIKDHLPENLASHTNIKGVLCQNLCQNHSQKQMAPFAWVNDVKILSASIEKIKNAIVQTYNSSSASE